MRIGYVSTKCVSRFDFQNPRTEDIRIEDIAHALSNLCRFNGHTRKFYSVAEHCCHVHDSLIDHKKWGLMHDAAEAYLGDIVNPVKALLPEFKVLEERLLQKVTERFGLKWPIPKLVHHIDVLMCKTEALDLLGEDFHFIDGNILDVTFPCWEPGIAQKQFMERYNENVRTESSSG